VRTLVDDPLGDGGAAVSNPAFSVADAGFTALFAFNCHELSVSFDVPELEQWATSSSRDLERLWDDQRGTWASRPLSQDEGERRSCHARTPDGLLGVLVSESQVHVDRVFEQLEDPAAFATPYGPSGRAVHEAGFEPDVYWRGPAWPQMSYLIYLGARRHGRLSLANRLSHATADAVLANNFAEFWNPITGDAAAAAAPQTWATIAVAMPAT
jgi:hypothetical protein